MMFAAAGWWQATGLFGLELLLVVLAVGLLEPLHKSPQWSRGVWRCGLICLVALSVLEWGGGAARLAAVVQRDPLPSPSIHQATGVVSEPYWASTPSAVDPVDLGQASSASSPGTLTPARRSPARWPGQRIAATAWAAGALFILGYLFVARLWLTLRLARLPQHFGLTEELGSLQALLKSRRRVRVIVSDNLVSPIAFGLVRPAIAVPSEFADGHTRPQQRAILLHELAHVTAHDPFWHLTADILSALLWWHPAVWWTRRRFLAACETAADDTVRLLPNGAATLAETLVQLGAAMRTRSSWAQGVAQGAAFRSGLGRRVERLISLPSPARPRSLFLRLILWIGPVCLVGGTVLSSAWARPHPPQPQLHMKNTYLIAATLLAATNLTTAQLDPRGAAPNPQPTLQQTVHVRPPPPRRGDQLLQRKLEQIVLEEVEYDSLPLGEVVKHLIKESIRLDPDAAGINFVFQASRQPPAIDPNTGLPASNTLDTSPDLEGVIVRIRPPLKNVRLIDVLDAMTRVADRPISYSVGDYAVMFALRNPQLGPTSLLAETFRIPPDTFFVGVEKTFGVQVRTAPPSQTQSDLIRFLNRLGVETEVAGKSAFYSLETGVLMVRLTPDEVALVDAAVRTIGGTLLNEAPQSRGGGFGGSEGYEGGSFGGGGSASGFGRTR